MARRWPAEMTRRVSTALVAEQPTQAARLARFGHLRRLARLCRSNPLGTQLRNLRLDLRQRCEGCAFPFEDRIVALLEIGRPDVAYQRTDHHVGTREFLLA